MFLGPETSHETLKKPKSRPRSTQRAPKARKKSAKKIPKNASVVKNALSWRSHFQYFHEIFKHFFFARFFKHFLHILFTTF